jgi:hypothetical protein
LNASKTFLADHLFNENGERLVDILQGGKFHKVMDKFKPLCSPNIQNLIASFKHTVDIKGPMDVSLKVEESLLHSR